MYSNDKYPKHCLPDPGIKTLNTKHIIATGSGKIGIAARIVELLTISAGSILLLLFAIFKTLNACYLYCSGGNSRNNLSKLKWFILSFQVKIVLKE